MLHSYFFSKSRLILVADVLLYESTTKGVRTDLYLLPKEMYLSHVSIKVSNRSLHTRTNSPLLRLLQERRKLSMQAQRHLFTSSLDRNLSINEQNQFGFKKSSEISIFCQLPLYIKQKLFFSVCLLVQNPELTYCRGRSRHSCQTCNGFKLIHYFLQHETRVRC